MPIRKVEENLYQNTDHVENLDKNEVGSGIVNAYESLLNIERQKILSSYRTFTKNTLINKKRLLEDNDDEARDEINRIYEIFHKQLTLLSCLCHILLQPEYSILQLQAC